MEEVKIVFENENFLVIDKDAGWVTTNENGREEKSIEEWLRNTRGDNKLKRQGIAHRLDKGTSGLLLVAKNQEELDDLKKKFKERLIKKVYIALVSGETSGDGEIEMPIGRNRYRFGQFKVVTDGKMAKTLFKKLESFNYGGKKYSLIEVNLKTGRTHQIRVHFKYLGWPLVGDGVYGGEIKLGLTRPFLHSNQLEWIDRRGKKWQFKSELASDLMLVLKQIND